MQIKKSVALCALALAGLAGQAHAAALTTAQKAVIDDANANNRILFISGASAVQKGFTGIISALIPGAKTFYTDKNGKDTAGKANTHSYEAVAGVLDSSAGGAWAGKNVILVYRVAGGSVWGVNPVARAQAIDSLNVSSTTCDDGATLQPTVPPPTTRPSSVRRTRVCRMPAFPTLPRHCSSNHSIPKAKSRPAN